MKKISNIAPYLFFAFAAVCLVVVFGGDPMLMIMPRQTSKYDPQMASSYSEKEAQQILRGTSKLETADIQNLLGWPKTTPVPAPPEQKQCDDCKEAVSLIKSERDDRITAEKENKTRSRVIFISTLVIGFAIFSLKHKKWGPDLIQDGEKRESAINIAEYTFGIWILFVSTFL